MEQLDKLFDITNTIKEGDIQLEFIKRESEVISGAKTAFWKEVQKRIRLRIMIATRELAHNVELSEKETIMLRMQIRELFWMQTIPEEFIKELKLTDEEGVPKDANAKEE